MVLPMVSELFHDIKDKSKDDDEDKGKNKDDDDDGGGDEDEEGGEVNTWDMNLVSCTALEDKYLKKGNLNVE